ncbi:hypothetical protein CMUST_10750 [Corynebacterium mustelae]|uniref:Uncharacterized protein n=1 Tax=Corynebacterium mustelae TaxID=571915 RepID=A0A0G3GZ74_9CORY|nr:hypothetical protein [Corynebacterium mustelae]AKK06466.1 hypothetical protein CMUST_10750 [Corynebacterium mustelae]
MTISRFLLTNDTRDHYGHTLYRLRYSTDCWPDIPGSRAGWVESAANIRGNADIGVDAIVWGNAVISGAACVSDYAEICGNAQVSGLATVGDRVHICGTARVYGDVHLCGRAIIAGDADVCSDSHWISIDPLDASGTHLTMFRTRSGHKVVIAPGAAIPLPRPLHYPPKPATYQAPTVITIDELDERFSTLTPWLTTVAQKWEQSQ